MLLAVNKAEGMGSGAAVAEFHELGLGQPYAISAAHGDGIVDLIELALKDLAPPVEEDPSRKARTITASSWPSSDVPTSASPRSSTR